MQLQVLKLFLSIRLNFSRNKIELHCSILQNGLLTLKNKSADNECGMILRLLKLSRFGAEKRLLFVAKCMCLVS